MSKKLLIRRSTDGALEECKTPYAVIECETEDDFLFLQEALAFYKQYNVQGHFEQLTLDEVLQLEGQSVYLEACWGSFCDYEGPAHILKAGSEGCCMEFDGKQHFFLNKWYGQTSGYRWTAFLDAHPK